MLRGDEDISSVATIPVSITSFTRDDFPFSPPIHTPMTALKSSQTGKK
jgi:hypothetical protein